MQRTFAETKIYSMAFNVDVSDATGAIVYGTRDHGIQSICGNSTPARGVTQVTHLNEHLDRSSSASPLIGWSTRRSEAARSVLLPPAMREAEAAVGRVGYGGNGSSSSTRSASSAVPPSTCSVANRGYAVLFPDAPVAKAARWRI